MDIQNKILKTYSSKGLGKRVSEVLREWLEKVGYGKTFRNYALL